MLRLLSACAVLGAFLGGCVLQKNSVSQAQGHFENAVREAVARYKGMYEVVEETAPTHAVVVSSRAVISYDRPSLVKTILDAGAHEIWLVHAKVWKEDIETEMNALRSYLGSAASKVRLFVNDAIPEDPNAKRKPYVWARDFSPISAFRKDAKGKPTLGFFDFNYYAGRILDDTIPDVLSRSLGIERISLPVYNEGGNFMSNGPRHCLMASRVLDANRETPAPDDSTLSESEIVAWYRDFLGCARVHIFPRMPYEKTGHIDLWAKFLNDEDIVVSQLRDETIASIESQEHKAKATEIQQFLEARAGDLRSLGYRILRIPMPAPLFRSKGKRDIIRTYTNSLVVNETVIVPSYDKVDLPSGDVDLGRIEYPDRGLKQIYEDEVRRVYESAVTITGKNLTVVFENADVFIAEGGAIHCVTMQIPESSEFHGLR